MSPSRPVPLSLLIAAAATGILATVIYLPSIPDMARDLGTSLEQIQLTLSVYLIAFGFGTLVHGPLSDRHGRRRVLLGGLVLCTAASIGCTLAPNVEVLLGWRALQGFGSAAGLVATRAVVRDVFGREDSARVLAGMAMAAALAPVLGPVVGGQIHTWLGWRANFAAVAGFSALLVTATWLWLPETNRQLQVAQGMLRTMAASYITLLSSRMFLAYSAVVTIAAAGFYAFSAAAPPILIERLGISPALYGVYAALPSTGFIAGSFIATRYTRHFGVDRMITIGTLLLAAGGVLMLVLALALPQSAATVVAPMVLFAFGNGVALPNASAGALSVFPQIAGAAAAIYGALQMVAGALGTVTIAALPQASSPHFAMVLAGIGVGAALAWQGLRVAGVARGQRI